MSPVESENGHKLNRRQALLLSAAAGMGAAVQAIAAVFAVVATLLGWAISSLIYHALSHLLGGRGSRNRMFALAGYASLPALAQQAIRLVGYWLGQATLANGNVPELLLDHFNVFAVIGLVLVGVAVKLNYGVSGRKATLIALTPSILTLLLGLWSLRAAGTASTEGQGTGLGGGLFGARRSGLIGEFSSRTELPRCSHLGDEGFSGA